MPSKKQKTPAEIMKLLLQLDKRIQEDELKFEKTKKGWYKKYLKTGILEFLKKNNLSNVCSEYDLVYASFPYISVQRASSVITEHVIQSANKRLDAKKVI